MNDAFQKKLTKIHDESKFVASLRNLKEAVGPSRLFGGAVRPLSEKEIQRLVAQGNLSPDWSKVLVAQGFRTDYIRGATFSGRCVLGVFSGVEREIAPGVMFPSGIYSSAIVSCEIGNECCIKNCGLIAHYCLCDNVVVFHTGSISARKGCTFGNGVGIPVGMETGGREIRSCAEIDVTIASAVAMRRHDKILMKCYEDFVEGYREGVTCDFGVIAANASVRHTPEICNTYIGESARIDGATFIENCTVLSGPEEPTEISHGAYVKNSCVQWGCEISSMAIVTDSLLTEHSHVRRHGKVTASIIGPNSEIAEGEVTSCLIGPFVGFHHQALLIAALWPEGKGNVAYGANVGSNHTSRAPDQEVFCGEGVFFGLGSSIKFPSDFSQAPYSIFATGVITLPQKLEFPFSLIQGPSLHFDGVFPSYNEIIPAWVLSDNIYMLLRNEEKYKNRNKAKRTNFEFTVFRPDIVDKMIKARNRLGSIKEKKTAYTDKDIPGIGKNVLREDRRSRAINAYTTYIEYYCLLGLKDRIAEIIRLKKEGALDSVYHEKTEAAGWEHQRFLLLQEGFGKLDLKQNLTRLISILKSVAHETLAAKEKDDVRGTAIIPDYREANVKASEDSFVVDITRQTGEASMKIGEMISLL